VGVEEKARDWDWRRDVTGDSDNDEDTDGIAVDGSREDMMRLLVLVCGVGCSRRVGVEKRVEEKERDEIIGVIGEF
jgi:hypothetical protein